MDRAGVGLVHGADYARCGVGRAGPGAVTVRHRCNFLPDPCTGMVDLLVLCAAVGGLLLLFPQLPGQGD